MKTGYRGSRITSQSEKSECVCTGGGVKVPGTIKMQDEEVPKVPNLST